MERSDISAYIALGIGSDPFRNGTDCCCAVHTAAGRYKKALNQLRVPEEGADIASLLRELEDSGRSILETGYRMAEVTAKVRVLEMRL